MKNLTRLERMSVVVEYTIDKLLANADKGNNNIYIPRYNALIHAFEKEVLQDITIDTARLNVSKIMEQIICYYINRSQTIHLIHQRYSGYKNIDFRKKEIDKLYKI